MGNKITNKGQLVLKYLKKYPKLGKRPLAALILKENHDVFGNLDNVISSVRYYTGQSGDKKRVIVSTKEHFTEAGTTHPYQIPESHKVDSNEVYFNLPIGNNKVLILSDVHIPYHDIKAVEKAVNYGIERGCNTVLLNGDIMDCQSISRYESDPRKRIPLDEELEKTREFLAWLKHKTKAKIYYKIGNHEVRMEAYLIRKAPELLGCSEWELRNLLRFGEFGIELIESMKIIKAGIMNIIHGHEMKFGGGIYPAKNLIERTGDNTICGHFHRTDYFSETNIRGNTIETFVTGCLCDLRPDYMPFRRRNSDWNMGFGYLQFDEESYTFDNIKL